MFQLAFDADHPVAFRGTRAVVIEIALVGATILTPIVAHLFAWPVLVVLPMFWGVMLSGVVFGWKVGLITGAISPILNHVLTGMPAPPMVPLMTVELALYGAVPSLIAAAGSRRNLALGMLVAALAGRTALLGGFLLTFGSMEGLLPFVLSSVVPGIPMTVVQMFMVPILGGLIIRAHERGR